MGRNKGPESCGNCGREINTRLGWKCPRCGYDNIRGQEFARNMNVGKHMTTAQFSAYSDAASEMNREASRAILSGQWDNAYSLDALADEDAQGPFSDDVEDVAAELTLQGMMRR